MNTNTMNKIYLLLETYISCYTDEIINILDLKKYLIIF